jgi:hypothetical protein
MSKTKLLTLLLTASALGACTTQTMDVPPEINVVDEKIAEAVEQASNANAAISEVEVATAAPVRAAPAAEIPASVVLPPESIQPVTVDWNGPVENFLEDIADRAGYEFIVSGRPPANQVMITISADNEPLFGVVRRAGNMIHGYADIGFNPGSQKIELRYGG